MTSITPLNGNQLWAFFYHETLRPSDPQTQLTLDLDLYISTTKVSRPERRTGLMFCRLTSLSLIYQACNSIFFSIPPTLVLVLALCRLGRSPVSTYKSNQGWFFAQLGCFIHPLFLLGFC